jgi:PqqD family protein of HPr-rel-A system
LIWRELDGELAVRNATSGSTHLLEPLASAVLRTLIEADAGLSVAELVAALREDAGAQDEWRAAIEAVLSEFQRLGLAEPDPS